MKTLTAFATAAVLALPAIATASSWQSDGTHTAAHFEVKHLMVSTVRGSFDTVSATLELDDKDISKSKVEATIDVASIDTGVDKRDGHLKSADFFDAENHPKLTFKSTKVKKAGKNKLKVVGDLTMRGATQPVTLTVTYGPEVKNPFSGTPTRGFHAEGTIDRTKWGLTWNKALESGGVIVGNEVKIIIDAEFAKATGDES